MKKRIKELGLDSGTEQVHRSKANCLRGCDYQIPGPILLMYPGGYWYRAVTPAAIERILQEHVLGGVPVEDLLVAQTPLQESPDPVPTSSTTSASDADEFFDSPPTEPVPLADIE
ncbi:MAG: ferredoxin [Synechococcus sp.]